MDVSTSQRLTKEHNAIYIMTPRLDVCSKVTSLEFTAGHMPIPFLFFCDPSTSSSSTARVRPNGR